MYEFIITTTTIIIITFMIITTDLPTQVLCTMYCTSTNVLSAARRTTHSLSLARS